MEIPFVGGAYSGRSTNLNAQVCQNLYFEVDQQGGKKQAALIGTPGMSLHSTTGVAGQVRGMYYWKSHLFVLVGRKWLVYSGGVFSEEGEIVTSVGKVWIAGGTDYIMICDGYNGYYQAYGDGTLATIMDLDFPIGFAGSLTYQDGYFIVNHSYEDSFHISASEDPSSWDGLDFASAEDEPDLGVVVASYNKELWVFGEWTTEVFYNSGDTDFPFSRVAGGVFDIGCAAKGSLAVGPEGIFSLDHRRQVRMSVGYQSQVISTPQVEYHIQNYTTVSDAIAYLYTQEGHCFYVLTFPSESKTWCYDVSTGVWHTRSSGTSGGRHRGNCHIFYDGKNLVGDYSNGNIYELDLGYYYDISSEIQRKRAAQVIHNDRKLLFHSQLEIEFESGVGLTTGLATGTANLTSGAVSSVTITDGGSGYSTAPIVQFSGGGGSGVVATATLTAGAVSAVTIVTGGSGYTSAPTVTFVGGTQDPQAMLDWSDDGGHTWSNEHWTSIGRIGEYSARAIWRRLGRSRNRIYRVTVTDPVKVVMLGAHLEANAGMT